MAGMAFPQLDGDVLSAVKHRRTHPQLVAAAGSGKTEVVAQRAAPVQRPATSMAEKKQLGSLPSDHGDR
jgi:excinuclease UvrABC helicase subunit UvrB